jgi:hypothetical protein
VTDIEPKSQPDIDPTERQRVAARGRQRKHRAGRKRIDYLPSPEANAVIDSLRTRRVRGMRVPSSTLSCGCSASADAIGR